MIRREPWSAEAEAALADALHGDGDIIRDEVQRGDAALWHFDTAKTRGYAVVRVEQIGNKRELVLVAGQGRGLIAGMEWLWNHYKKQFGVNSIRTHVKNPALLRLLKRNNAGIKFKFKEIVLEGTPDGRIEQQQQHQQDG